MFLIRMTFVIQVERELTIWEPKQITSVNELLQENKGV